MDYRDLAGTVEPEHAQVKVVRHDSTGHETA